MLKRTVTSAKNSHAIINKLYTSILSTSVSTESRISPSQPEQIQYVCRYIGILGWRISRLCRDSYASTSSQNKQPRPSDSQWSCLRRRPHNKTLQHPDRRIPHRAPGTSYNEAVGTWHHKCTPARQPETLYGSSTTNAHNHRKHDCRSKTTPAQPEKS